MRWQTGFLMVSALSGVACAARTPADNSALTLSQAPSWFTAPASDSTAYFEGRATSVSRDMQLAIDNAAGAARLSVAQQVEPFVTGTTKTATEQAGAAGDETAIRLVQTATLEEVQTTLHSVQIDRQDVRTEPDGRYRSYVRVRMAKGAVEEALRNHLQQDQALYARVRGTEIMSHLDADVAAYEQAKAAKQGGAPTQPPTRPSQ